MMWERTLGPIRLCVEHREQGADGGPTLRVYSSAEPPRELLRFDCFKESPHYHIDPPGRNLITPLDRRDDTIAVVMEDLARDLEGYLKRAGLELTRPFDRTLASEALKLVEDEMRNPPLDLDALDVEGLRRRRGEKWQVFDADVLPAWVADMDYPVPEPVLQTLRRAVERSDVGYPLPPWMTGLREVFVERMVRRFDWSVDPERVEIVTDVVQAIYVGLEVFAERGDGVVIQTPIYPPFLHAVSETGRRLVPNTLLWGPDRYELDLDRLHRDVDPSTRILLLCSPHNPSGRVFTRSELESLAEIALANDWIVISDEIHGELVFSGHQHIPFATLSPEVEARTITLTSPSKTFSIAGLRCAVAVFGSEELQKQFLSVPRHVRGGIGTLGLEASLAAWRYGQPWLDRVMAHLEENRNWLASFVRERWPAVEHFPPEATYLAWLDFRAYELKGGPGGFFLDQARVGLSRGESFGPGGDGFVRLNFATSRAILTEILSRMNEALERAGRAL
jgi:cystathionine beta-lyase